MVLATFVGRRVPFVPMLALAAVLCSIVLNSAPDAYFPKTDRLFFLFIEGFHARFRMGLGLTWADNLRKRFSGLQVALLRAIQRKPGGSLVPFGGDLYDRSVAS